MIAVLIIVGLLSVCSAALGAALCTGTPESMRVDDGEQIAAIVAPQRISA